LGKEKALDTGEIKFTEAEKERLSSSAKEPFPQLTLKRNSVPARKSYHKQDVALTV